MVDFNQKGQKRPAISKKLQTKQLNSRTRRKTLEINKIHYLQRQKLPVKHITGLLDATTIQTMTFYDVLGSWRV